MSTSPTVNPIPEGFHTVTPHLVCADAGKAIDFYVKAFNAEEIMRVPGPVDGKLIHASITIGDSRVMLVDEFPDMGCVGPLALKGSPVTLHLQVKDVDASFDQAVKAGATVIMPIADMFWGDRYGMVQDPFGHKWSIATHIKDVSHEELAKSAASAECMQES